MAESSGGVATIDSNDQDAAVNRMLAEGATHYLIGYYSPAPANDGKHHRITVRTRREGLMVRAREGYNSPGPTRSHFLPHRADWIPARAHYGR